MYPTVPDRVSNAGPGSQDPLDWRDQLWVATENIQAAQRMEADGHNYNAPGAKLNASRIAAIDYARRALEEAKELLCKLEPVGPNRRRPRRGNGAPGARRRCRG